ERLPSSIPPLGFSPFPTVNTNGFDSRLRAVALPMDHQMLPIITEMVMTGFRLDLSQWQEIDSWLRRMKMRIRKRLEELGYGQIKITSSADRLMIMESMITALAQRVMEISQAVATAVPGR